MGIIVELPKLMYIMLIITSILLIISSAYHIFCQPTTSPVTLSNIESLVVIGIAAGGVFSTIVTIIISHMFVKWRVSAIEKQINSRDADYAERIKTCHKIFSTKELSDAQQINVESRIKELKDEVKDGFEKQDKRLNRIESIMLKNNTSSWGSE